MNQIEERKRMVLAMEYVARQINHEGIFEGWLMNGVADGDIRYGSFQWDGDEYDDYYLEDDHFRDLMWCFLRRMVLAWEEGNGGLYCGGVCSDDRGDKDSWEKE